MVSRFFFILLYRITARSYKKISDIAIVEGKKVVFVSVIYAVVHFLVLHEAWVYGSEIVTENVFGTE